MLHICVFNYRTGAFLTFRGGYDMRQQVIGLACNFLTINVWPSVSDFRFNLVVTPIYQPTQWDLFNIFEILLISCWQYARAIRLV